MELFTENKVSNSVMCVLKALENTLKGICPSAEKNYLYSFQKLCVIEEKTG